MTSAFCFFCDDIRQEVSGKLMYLGVYVGECVVPELPVTIPSIHLVLDVWQGRDERVTERTDVILTFPDGAERKFSFGPLMSLEARAKLEEDPEVVNLMAQYYIPLKDLQFAKEGRLKVDVETDGGRVRAGSLKIRAAHQPGIPPSP